MAPYNVDIIFIACNTLSVIYKETEFAKTCPIPVPRRVVNRARPPVKDMLGYTPCIV